MKTDGSSFTTLHNFNGNDGAFPFGDLKIDGSGKLFGTTAGGGAYNDGTVFEYSQGKLKTLVSLDGSDMGYDPSAGLNLDQGGNLWGSASFGGPDDLGLVFELTPNGSDKWDFNVVHDFAWGTDGAHPSYGRVVFGKQGSVFGKTLA